MVRAAAEWLSAAFPPKQAVPMALLPSTAPRPPVGSKLAVASLATEGRRGMVISAAHLVGAEGAWPSSPPARVAPFPPDQHEADKLSVYRPGSPVVPTISVAAAEVLPAGALAASALVISPAPPAGKPTGTVHPTIARRNHYKMLPSAPSTKALSAPVQHVKVSGAPSVQEERGRPHLPMETEQGEEKQAGLSAHTTFIPAQVTPPTDAQPLMRALLSRSFPFFM